MIRTGELKGVITQNDGAFPHYKVIVDDENPMGFYTKEYVEKLVRENEELKIKLDTALKILS